MGVVIRVGRIAMFAAIGLLTAAAGAWPTGIRFDESGMLRTRAGGFEVRVAPALAAEPDLCAQVLSTLRADLRVVGGALPADALAVLRERTTIWIEKQGAVVEGGMSGRGMVYHPSAFWLRANGLDPARAGGVEIVRAADYLAWRETQPMMVCHELAHAYHHLIGPDEPTVLAAFASASASGDYEAVRRAPSRSGRSADEFVRAYALTNAKEYFAELSEALFGRNDFEPFDRAALEAFDPKGADAIARLWRLDRAAIEARAEDGKAAEDADAGER